MNPPKPPRPRRIEILAFPDVQLLDVTGPLQVFASANALQPEQRSPPPYAVRVIARQHAIVTSSGLQIVAHPLPRARVPVDTLIVAGGAGVRAAAADAALLTWLARRALHARRVVSICTGAFLLAAAGLLTGRRAVTHWAECARLAASYSDVSVETDPIFIEDGNVWTSAGVTAGLDLCLMLVERDLVVFLRRPGGQAQFSTLLAIEEAGAPFSDLQAWIAQNLNRDLSVGRLAAKSGMSERSFLRHFRSATGMTPARAVERIRVETARQMLTSTRRSVKAVARACGFGSDETMRRSFIRRVGISPADYRSRFTIVIPR